MSTTSKRIYTEIQKPTQINSSNINSFRVVSNNVPEKGKVEKDKVISPILILQLAEKQDKDVESIKKQLIKPKLLTGKLPSAFGVKLKRIGNDLIRCDSSPRKIFLNENIHQHLNICITEGDEASSSNTKDAILTKKQYSAKSSKRACSGIFLSDYDRQSELKTKDNSEKLSDASETNFTKPVIKKSNSHVNSNRNDSKLIAQNNFLINITSNSNVQSEKSTGNNSQGSQSNFIQSNGNRVSSSRTHDAFFPKIKNNFDNNESETSEISNEIKKKYNSKNGYVINMNNGNNSNINAPEALKEEDIRLEDGISLSYLKNNSNNILKKVFHLPNFEIYSIKEIPMSSKFFISNFREKLNHWKNKIGSSSRFVKIYNESLNNPEGFISLVMDYLPGFSLQEIIDNVGIINESVLCKLAIQIIQCLQEYKEKFGEDFFDFCTCDVLFDKKGNLKLKQKFLDYKCIDKVVENSEVNVQCKCFDHFHTNLKQKINTNRFFDLGFIMLISASGGMKFESLDYFSFNYKSLLKIPYLKNCCLLHLLISLESSSPLLFNSKIRISHFINNKIFSENFIDFLCKTLSFERKTVTSAVVLNHPWIQISNYVLLNNKHNRVRVSMKEMIKITSELKKAQNKQTFKTNEKKLNSFLNNFDIILSNNKKIKKDELIQNIKNKKFIIKELASEFGLNPEDLKSKLRNKVTIDVN